MTRLINERAFAIITIWQEARGETFEGKVAIAEVIRNRMKTRYSSDGTISGTVLKPYRFSEWNTNDPNSIASLRLDDSDPVVQACERAWETALGGSDLTHGAVLYVNLKAVKRVPVWARDEDRVVEIGRHTFYSA